MSTGPSEAKGLSCVPLVTIFFSGTGNIPVCQAWVTLPWPPRTPLSAGRGQDVELQPRWEASTYR